MGDVLVVLGLCVNLFSPIKETAQPEGIQFIIKDGMATLLYEQ